MRHIFFLFLALFLAVYAPPIYADLLQAPAPPTLREALEAASGPLAASAVAILISILVELWPAYENQTPRTKRIAYFVLCLVVPLLAATARALLNYAPWSLADLFWPALWYGLAAAGIGTLYHTRKLKPQATILIYEPATGLFRTVPANATRHDNLISEEGFVRPDLILPSDS